MRGTGAVEIGAMDLMPGPETLRNQKIYRLSD